MKLPAGQPPDRRPHTYCPGCLRAGTLRRRYLKRGADYFVCGSCGYRGYRTIFIDPKVNWWLDKQREVWHESVGVVVRNDRGRILMFHRRLFPPQVTIPAGHREVALSVGQNAVKELAEETGLTGLHLTPLFEFDSPGDQCIRGADYHHWHAFITQVIGEPGVTINYEGKQPFWATPAEALKLELTPPVRQIMRKL